MEFAIVENGKVKEILVKPLWFFAQDTKYGKTGEQVTDEYLINEEGWFRIIDNYPINIDTNLFLIELDDKENWEIDFNKKIVKKTYKIIPLDIQDVINNLKQNFLTQLKIKFETKITKGYLYIEELNITVNSDRNALQNINSLINYTETLKIQKVLFRLFDNTFIELTTNELLFIKEKIIEYGIQVYQWKWEKEKEIYNLNTYEECLNYKLE